MSKKDEAKQELRKAKEEAAATVSTEWGKERSRFSGVKYVLAVLAAIMFIAIGYGATFFSPSKTQQQETTVFVEQIRELAMLATAEAQVTLVHEEVDYKLFGQDIPFQFQLPGTKRELLLIVPATVVAGIDFQGVTSTDLHLDEEQRVLSITVPRATFLQEPAILMDKVKTYTEKGLLSGDVKWDEGFELAAEAQEEIKTQAIDMGLLETAEQNAEKVLNGLFTHLGYTVKVTYE